MSHRYNLHRCGLEYHGFFVREPAMAIPHRATMSRSVLPAPACLRGLVRYFHIEHNTGGQVKLPATPYPILSFFISGGAVTERADGTLQVFDEPFVSGPIMSAFNATWLPGTSFVSAVCEPARFGRLFGVSVHELRDQAPALSVLAPQLATRQVQDELQRHCGAAAWAQILGEWLLALAARQEERLRGAYELPGAALFAPVADIATQFGLSVRQLERNHLGTYGMTISESRRMARYTTALVLLMGQPQRRGVLTHIAASAGYHDQAHMIRDFNALLGITPGSVAGNGDMDASLRLLRYDERETRVIGVSWKAGHAPVTQAC